MVIGLYINGNVKKPLFLRVDNKTKTIGFSPVELSTGTLGAGNREQGIGSRQQPVAGSLWLVATRDSERCEGLLEARFIFHIDAGLGAVDLAH